MAGVMMGQGQGGGGPLGLGKEVGGGLSGAATGAQIGGPWGAAIGGTLGALGAGGKPQVGPVQSTAISRRIETAQQAPGAQLAQADAALAQLPPEYQQAYAAPIKKAREADALSRGAV